MFRYILDFDCMVELCDFMDEDFFMENLYSGALPAFTVEEWNKLSDADKRKRTKLHFRMQYPIMMKVRKGMKYLYWENIVVDLDGQPLVLNQKIPREASTPKPKIMSKKKVTTSTVPATIRKRKQAEDVVNNILSKKKKQVEPQPGCSKNLCTPTPSNSPTGFKVLNKSMEQLDLESYRKRQKEKLRPSFRLADIPDSKFVDSSVSVNNVMEVDGQVEENEQNDSQVSLEVVISDQTSTHVEQIEFLKTSEMSNEEIGKWVSRPDCTLEVLLEYFSRKNFIDSSGRQVGSGDNTKEVNLAPKIFRSQRKYPIKVFEVLLEIPKLKESAVVADTKKLHLQKQMFLNLKGSRKVGTKIVSVIEISDKQFRVVICETGPNEFHAQALPFTLHEFQEFLSVGPSVLAVGVRQMIDKIKNEAINEINKEVDEVRKKVLKLRKDLAEGKYVNDSQIAEAESLKSELGYELSQLHKRTFEKNKAWAKRVQSIEFNLGECDIINVTFDDQEYNVRSSE